MTLSCSVSSGSRYSTDIETDDDLPIDSRGRVYSNSLQNGNGGPKNSSSPSTLRKLSPNGTSSADSTGTGACKTRTSFTRSHSPSLRAPLNLKPPTKSNRHTSPSLPHEPRTYLAAEFRLPLGLPLGLPSCTFSIDKRKLGESVLLLLSLLYSASHIRNYSPDVQFTGNADASVWCSYGNDFSKIQNSQISNYYAELQLLSFASFLYVIWTHTTVTHVNDRSEPNRETVSIASTSSLTRPSSPRLVDVKEPRKHPLPPLWNKNNFGYVWMSVPKNYRCVLRFFLFYIADSIGNQRVERRRYSHWFTSWTSHRIFPPFFLAETNIKWWDRSPCRLAN